MVSTELPEELNSGSAQWLHFVAATAQGQGAHIVVAAVAEAPQHFAVELVVAEAPQHFAIELVVAEARHFEVLRFHWAVRDLLETSHSMHLSLEP